MAKKRTITEQELAEAIKLSREEAIREERERLGLINSPSGKLVGKTKMCKVYGRNVFSPKCFNDSFWVSVLDVSDRLPNDRRSRRKWWGGIYHDEIINSEQAEKEGIWIEGKHFTEKEWIEELKKGKYGSTARDHMLKKGGGIREKIFLPRTFLEQLPRESWTEDAQGKKQGASIQFNYDNIGMPRESPFRRTREEKIYRTSVLGLPDLPKPKRVGAGIVQYVSRVQNYVNGKLNGPTVYFGGNYRETGFEYYKDGKQHGLARHRTEDGKDWEYSYWENGKKIMDDAQTRAFLAERIEKLKAEKLADSSARSTTLRKVLKAGTKTQKMRILSKFHSQGPSAPVKRHVSGVLRDQFIKNSVKR